MAEFMNGVEKCILRSRNYKYRDVSLPHALSVIVGRGPQTRIRERRCSKAQVEVTADYHSLKATIKQLGGNPSEVDGKLLCSAQSAEVADGCNINLIPDELKYTLEFIRNVDQLKLKKGLLFNMNDTQMDTTVAITPKRETDCDASSAKKVKHDEDEDESVNWSSPYAQVNRQLNAIGETSIAQVNTQLNAVGEPSVAQVDTQLNAIGESLREDMECLSTENTWEEYDHSKLLMYTTAGVKGSNKVAAFDMDHTIITTKSGKVFPVDTFDWKILYAEVPGKLKELNQKGYKIIIFTNQKGISRGKTYLPDFKKKIQSVIKRFGVPVQAFVSTGSGKYRKPNTGMWNYFEQKGNQGIAVDMASSIYVGDAAGRPVNWAPKKKKDFSCADRLFAMNLQLQFFTPEEFFLKKKPAAFNMPSFDPRKVGNTSLAVRYKPAAENTIMEEKNLISDSLEMIVFVGYPASGKSHFVQTYLIPKGYVHINRDNLGSWQKCVSESVKALSQGKKVVVDNTNPDKESRSRYIECAQKFKVPCRCFLFKCDLEQARHNNRFRELQYPDAKHAGVNDMIFNSYKSKYKEPTLQEGFSEILHINFVPKFKNKPDETLYKLFLLEK